MPVTLHTNKLHINDLSMSGSMDILTYETQESLDAIHAQMNPENGTLVLEREDFITTTNSKLQVLEDKKDQLTLDIGVEEQRATDIKDALKDKIDSESTRANGIKTGLTSYINNESGRITGIKSDLTTYINNENTRIAGVKNDLTSYINNENTRITGIKNDLSGFITGKDGEIDQIKTDIQDLSTAEQQEITEHAEASIQDVDSRLALAIDNATEAAQTAIVDENIRTMLASYLDLSKDYNKNDFYMATTVTAATETTPATTDSKLYKFLTDHPAGEVDESTVVETSIADEFSNLHNGLIHHSVTTGNILDLSILHKQKIINEDGGLNPAEPDKNGKIPKISTTNFLPVEPNTTYYIKKDGVLCRQHVIAFYSDCKESARIPDPNDPTKILRYVLADSKETDPEIIWRSAKFTTPDNCHYIRITERANRGYFNPESKLLVTSDPTMTYQPHIINNDFQYNAEFQQIQNEIKIDASKYLINGFIQGSKGYWTQTVAGTDSFLIPVFQNQKITMTASDKAFAYAFLTDNTIYQGVEVSYGNLYRMGTEDDGEQEGQWIQESGKDTRHVVAKKKTVSIIVPPLFDNDKIPIYLYITNNSEIENNIVSTCPAFLQIDDKIYWDNTPKEDNTEEKETKQYTTIFFDDFDTLDKNVWHFHKDQLPKKVDKEDLDKANDIVYETDQNGYVIFNEDNTPKIKSDPYGTIDDYRSVFYTTDDNVSVNSSCLILKCIKAKEEEQGTEKNQLGQYRKFYPTESGCGTKTIELKTKDNEDNDVILPQSFNIHYGLENIDSKAAYISTYKSFAIKEGRISARIKASQPIDPTSCMWCFWTWGQNAGWRYAHEMDIIEFSNKFTRSKIIPKADKDNPIPKGSAKAVMAINSHFRDALVEEKTEIIEKDNVNKEYLYYVRTHKNYDTSYSVNINYANMIDNNTFDTTKNYLKRVNPMEWHIYMVEWDKENIYYYIDDELVQIINPIFTKKKADDTEEEYHLVYKNSTPNVKVDITEKTANERAAIITQMKQEIENDTGFFYPQHICFNIKARQLAEEEGALYVDWVKAETTDLTPVTSMRLEGYDDNENPIEIKVKEIIEQKDDNKRIIKQTATYENKYLNPIFNSDFVNHAFEVEIIKNSDVLSYTDINPYTGMAYHLLTGLSIFKSEIENETEEEEEEKTDAININDIHEETETTIVETTDGEETIEWYTAMLKLKSAVNPSVTYSVKVRIQKPKFNNPVNNNESEENNNQ